MKFKLVLADPPWPERGGGKIKRGADRHYALMSTDDIVQLDAPVRSVSEDDCYLLLWVTSNYRGVAESRVMPAWGFRPVTDWVWVKPKPPGLGQYRRSRHEHLLLGVRGRPPMPKKAWPDSVIEAPRGEHSAKPRVQYDIAENQCPSSTGFNKLEMFARNPPPSGWIGIGDALDFCPIGKALRELAGLQL